MMSSSVVAERLGPVGPSMYDWVREIPRPVTEPRRL